MDIIVSSRSNLNEMVDGGEREHGAQEGNDDRDPIIVCALVHEVKYIVKYYHYIHDMCVNMAGALSRCSLNTTGPTLSSTRIFNSFSSFIFIFLAR